MKAKAPTDPALRLVYVTAPDREAALHMARTVVCERLAACANVIDRVSSVYRWDGAVQEDSEAVLILKTRHTLVGDLSTRLAEIHPYDCPCVVSLAINDGHQPFLDWVVKETS